MPGSDKGEMSFSFFLLRLSKGKKAQADRNKKLWQSSWSIFNNRWYNSRASSSSGGYF